MDGSTPTHILLAKIQLTGLKLLSLVWIFGCIFGCIFDTGLERVGGSGMRDGFEQNHIPKTFKTIHKTVKSNIEKKQVI